MSIVSSYFLAPLSLTLFPRCWQCSLARPPHSIAPPQRRRLGAGDVPRRLSIAHHRRYQVISLAPLFSRSIPFLSLLDMKDRFPVWKKKKGKKFEGIELIIAPTHLEEKKKQESKLQDLSPLFSPFLSSACEKFEFLYDFA